MILIHVPRRKLELNFVELDIVDQHGLPALSCFTELCCLVLLKNERV